MIRRRVRTDTGVVALPLLMVAMGLLVTALALAVGAQIAVAGSRARAAADLAALAAARHLAAPDLACDAAARFAAANGARLVACVAASDAVALRVAVDLSGAAQRFGLPRQVEATARAGY